MSKLFFSARWPQALFFFMVLNLSVVKANEYDTRFEPDVVFYGDDGVKIAGNVFLPVPKTINEKFPAIVFVNSWSLDENEYLVQAKRFAKEGFIVLSYSARGWGESGGLVNVGGPQDMQDFSSAVDWLMTHTPADENNLGAAGISYGGGMSLLAAANDDRVKAVASMSGWADLLEALYGGESADLVWGSLLVGSGYLTGNMDPIILQQFQNILTNNDIEQVRDWARLRSPMTFIDEYNQRGTAIYISNNLRDELFEPNSMVDFYEALETPKKLDLNLGNHATTELVGLIGLRSHIWDNVHDWFKLHLQAEDINLEPAVSIAIKFTEERDNFSSWPSADIETKTFHLGARNWFFNGSLRDSPYTYNDSNHFHSGYWSGANAGTHVLSSILEAYVDIHIYNIIYFMSRDLAIVYQGERLSSEMSIRGAPELDLWIKPSRSEAQVIAYLYDVDAWGNGKLISHAPIAVRDVEPNQPLQVNLSLYFTAYDVPAGHSLALALDTHDAQYAPPTLQSYEINIPYGVGFDSQLTLPFVK
ncbi:MAG: alpha/beta fold hydrolase [Pseudomonadota bacterium]